VRSWVNGRWFAPGEWKKRGVDGKFDGVYMPFFTFDAATFTRYSGERGDAYYVEVGSGEQKRRERRVRWSHAAGAFQRFFDDICIPALQSLPQSLPEIAGHEIDGALASGSRGGLDYYGAAMVEDALVAYLISGEGQSAVSVVAARMARDEIQRALTQGAAPRKALSHANRVLQQSLPVGVCAKATLLQVSQSGAKLYQAGARSPLLVCQRGELREVAAEGLALGLDDGPVFEKSLRPQEIAMTAGMRLLLVNEAALRTQAFRERVLEHTARHTAMFMNMVLGGIEEDAGSDGLREDVVVLTCKRNA
jgi:hypothetical protein